MACSAGTFSTGTGMNLRAACLSCQAGSYQALSGGTVCILCSAGTFQTGTGISTSATCASCAAGTYSRAGFSACIGCPNNTWSGSGSISCTVNAGYHSQASSICFPSAGMTAATSINSETFIASGSRIISPGNPELPWMAFNYVLQSTLGLPAQDWTTLTPAYSGTGGNGLKAYGTTTFFPVMDGTTYFGEWLQLQVGTSRTLGKHSFQAAMYNSARAPSQYVVAGSNYGINWGIIDSQISLTAWTVNYIQNCQCVFTGHTFIYFRLIVLATGATGDGSIHRGVVSVFKYCISVSVSD
jgi:hypothetical protein